MLFENRSSRNPKEVSHQPSLLKTWTKSFGNEKVKAVNGVYNRRTSKCNNTVSHEEMEKDRFKRTIKELIQFDYKKQEELESDFDHFDLDNSYLSSPFKGRNFVDLDFVYK